MLKKTATIGYQDGHEDTVILTARAQCQAEEHAQTNGWGPVENCKIWFVYCFAYTAARQQGKTALPYGQWLDSILDVVVNTPDDTEDAQLDPTN